MKLVSYLKKSCIFLLCIAVLSLIPMSATGAPGEPLRDKFEVRTTEQNGVQSFVQEPYYGEIKDGYQKSGYKPSNNVEVVLDAESIISSDRGDIPLKTGLGDKKQQALSWDSSYQWFEWEVDIPQSGLYEIDMEYYPLPASGMPIQREIMIDGEIPFAEAHNITFPRMWRDEGEPKVNNLGDEVKPGQIEVVEWRTMTLTDNIGMYAEPFQFFFSQGTHVIRMNYVDQPAAFGAMTIHSPRIIPTYAEYKEMSSNKQSAQGDTSEPIIIQAEDTVIKNDPTIRPGSDGDPACDPVSRGYRKLNVIGDWWWAKGQQSITWELNVPEDGLYKIGMRVAQRRGDGLPVYRQIAIDGEVPFAEVQEYRFNPEGGDWKTETLQEPSGQPYLFYLDKGKHYLTMTAKMGTPIEKVIHDINDDALLLSTITRQIIMITGGDPDPNFEYNLDRRIPTLMEDLKHISDSLQTQIDRLTVIAEGRPVMANNLATIKSQIDNMLKDADSIPTSLNDLNNAQANLGTWYVDLQYSPLLVDYFIFSVPDASLPVRHSNVFQRLYTSWVNFALSFSKDYDNVGSIYESDDTATTLNVWVARGKEWAEIMKEMADEDFTAKTGIQINMNVVPASQLNAGAVNALMLAITSGKAPDVALGVAADSPVEFAIRGAAVDLKQFEDYEDVEKRFIPGIMIPFKYEGGVYALPETMNFQVLFYRKDIISELGIKIPDTWDELYKEVLPILYRNGMQFYYPTNFTPFLYQLGGNYYTDDGKYSALDTPEAYRAFKEYTELFTSYGVPPVANFFNRFRSGEMPMGVGDYYLYTQLSTAAPELFGRWGIAPIPGHERPDGVIDRTVGGAASATPGASGGMAGQSALILSQSEYQQEAWQFLEWWTSNDVQARFGRELEALMGAQARWNTANVEAFKGIPWKLEDLRIIEDQWQWFKEQPVVLGGYFTGRHVTNAWNRVVLGGMNVRDSLEQAVKDINAELRAKQEEYGVTAAQPMLEEEEESDGR